MAKLTVLIEGYAREIEGGWVASSTTVLVQDNGLNIIVDPGTNKRLLLEKLSQLELKTSDINYVLTTHYHFDHNYLMAIFEKAKVLDDGLIYDGDKEIEYKGFIPGTELEVIPTPGHEKFHCSLAVPTPEGITVIAGDVFWWDDAEEQKTDKDSLLNHKDPFMKDKNALLESRKKLLAMADFIIPGHGKMFKVEK